MVAVADDPDVIATQEPLAIAHAKLAALEAEEKHLIRLDSIWVDRATDEDIEQARDEAQALNASYQAAVTAAKERLSAAGLEQLKPLCALG